VANCCFDRLITNRVKTEIVEVAFRQVGQNGRAVGRAVGDDANPNCRGPQWKLILCNRFHGLLERNDVDRRGQDCRKMGEAYQWKFHGRGEERCVRYSHGKNVADDPENVSLWDGQIRRE
jgi:hypothetical protein